jgi:hypothetical protein
LGAAEKGGSGSCSGWVRAMLVLVVVMVRVGMRVRMTRVGVGDLFDAVVNEKQADQVSGLRRQNLPHVMTYTIIRTKPD